MTDQMLPFHKLHSLQVEVSSICNLSCAQCFNKLPGHISAIMVPDLWNAKIKPYLGQLENVYLVGIGEPLMSPHFLTFMRDVVIAGAKAHTTTNLQLMTPDLAEAMVEGGLHSLSFSCDATDGYSVIRRGGTLETLESALQFLTGAKAWHNSTLPLLCLNFGASVRNITELPDVMRLADHYHISSVIAYHNIIYREADRQESLYYHQELSDQMFKRAAQFCQEKGILFMSPGLFSRPLVPTVKSPYCTYPFNHLYVYADGRVGACCMDFVDSVILGDLRRETMAEIWNGEKIQAMRRMLCGEPSYNCRYCASPMKMTISDPRYLLRFGVTET